MTGENVTIDPLNPRIDLNQLQSLLPVELQDRISDLIFISKIAVYIFIGYVIFLIIKSIFAWRRNTRIDKTYRTVIEIDKKIDVLLKRTKEKEKEHHEQLEKKEHRGFFAWLFGRKEEEDNDISGKKHRK
jgi:hypothetical protein